MILTMGACLAFWYKMAVYGMVMLLFLTVVIERIIHTTYTITTENELIVYYGRFMRKRIIPIKSVSFWTESEGRTQARPCGNNRVTVP